MRIDSYESEAHQKYVRTFLNGRFENSAFCLLAPNGQDWLSRGGRGPEMVLGHNSSVSRMNSVAADYPAKASLQDALVPDFHSVRQAINVASADQRVLVLVHGSNDQLKLLQTSLKPVANDERIIGRFHFDFEESSEWKKTVTGTNGEAGIHVIRAGEFGLDGSVMHQLPLDAPVEEVIRVLMSANAEFAKTTEKKVYSSHVNKGTRLGVYFEGAVPYGEDRDGDGQIDRRGRGPIRVSPRGGRSLPD